MTLSPNPWDVAIDDHGYMLDLDPNKQMRRESIPLLRPIFVTADRLGENDINPESLWRFSDRDWSHGAGQHHADLPQSDTSRFWRSRGVDVWTRWQVSLLEDLVQESTPGGSRLFEVANTIYKVDNSGSPGHPGLAFGWPSFANVVVTGAALGACTDGKVVYYSDSTAVFSINPGVTTPHSTYNTVSGIDQLYYVNGRLIGVGPTGHILDLQSGASFTDLGTLPGNFMPVDMTSGADAIYIAAADSNTGLSQVFAITIEPTGTALNPPVAVTPPFNGVLRRILSYEGLVFIGSKTGVRMATPSADGLNLSLGPLIATGNCSALAGYGGQVWFGIDSYELDESGVTYWSGLGRLNPQVINDDGAPAWATDLMASGFASSGFPVVTDVFIDGTTGGIYVLAGDATYARSGFLVSSGYVESGLISYDLPDAKSPRYLTVRTDMTSQGDIVPSLAVDGSTTFTALTTVPAGTIMARNPITGIPAAGEFEIRETLNRSTVDPTKGAVLTRHMLESDPIIASGFFFYVPVILAESVQGADEQDKHVSPATELAYLMNLRETGTVVTYTELGTATQVTVEDIQWSPTHITHKRDGMNGTAVLKLKTV